MKLKKVTALLLATSMVLTSVNVAPIFADEEITFAEENYTVEDDASADADFGDVVVEDEAPADDVVEGDTFVGDDLVAEGESYIDEDTVVEDDGVIDDAYAGNEDILAAVQASEDASYAADYNMTVTGEAFMEYGYEGELTPYIRKSNSGDSCTNIAGASFSVAEVSASENCLIITVNGSDEALAKFHFTGNE